MRIHNKLNTMSLSSEIYNLFPSVFSNQLPPSPPIWTFSTFTIEFNIVAECVLALQPVLQCHRKYHWNWSLKLYWKYVTYKGKVIGDISITWFNIFSITFWISISWFYYFQRIIKMADKDMSGTLSYEEFIGAVTDWYLCAPRLGYLHKF